MRAGTDAGGEFSRPRSPERTYLTPSRQARQEERNSTVTQLLRERLRFRYRLEDPWRLGALA